MAMRVFVSHTASDHPLAEYLSAALDQVGVQTFMFPEDAAPGTSWMEAIRAGLRVCDEAVSIMTVRSTGRPWIAAEWTAFWLQEKPCTALLLDTPNDKLWDPMRTLQAVSVTDPTRLLPLLKRWADATSIQPPSGLIPLAREISSECAGILVRLQREEVGIVLSRVAANVSYGTDNVDPADISLLVAANRVTELVDLATSPNASNVKKRQIGMGLVANGRHGEALAVSLAIDNRAEAKNVAVAVVNHMAPSALESSEEWAFLIGIFPHLGEAQHRVVLERLHARGVYPLGPWASQI